MSIHDGQVGQASMPETHTAANSGNPHISSNTRRFDLGEAVPALIQQQAMPDDPRNGELRWDLPTPAQVTVKRDRKYANPVSGWSMVNIADDRGSMAYAAPFAPVSTQVTAISSVLESRKSFVERPSLVAALSLIDVFLIFHLFI